MIANQICANIHVVLVSFVIISFPYTCMVCSRLMDKSNTNPDLVVGNLFIQFGYPVKVRQDFGALSALL